MNFQFNKLEVIAKVAKDAMRAVQASAIQLQGRIQDRLNLRSSNIGSGGQSSPPGEPPANRTGALMRSVQAIDVTTDRMRPTWRVGTALPYAKIQEFGGLIRPKKGRFLPVPIGVAGQRAMREAKGNLRSLNLKVFRSPDGKLFLYRPADTSSKKRKLRTDHLLFRLVKSVYLPPRPYFRPSIAEHQAAIKDEFGKEMEKHRGGV